MKVGWRTGAVMACCCSLFLPGIVFMERGSGSISSAFKGNEGHVGAWMNKRFITLVLLDCFFLRTTKISKEFHIANP